MPRKRMRTSQWEGWCWLGSHSVWSDHYKSHSSLLNFSKSILSSQVCVGRQFGWIISWFQSPQLRKQGACVGWWWWWPAIPDASVWYEAWVDPTWFENATCWPFVWPSDGFQPSSSSNMHDCVGQWQQWWWWLSIPDAGVGGTKLAWLGNATGWWDIRTGSNVTSGHHCHDEDEDGDDVHGKTTWI